MRDVEPRSEAPRLLFATVLGAMVVGVGGVAGYEYGTQHAANEDFQAIDACKPLIAELPTKGLPTNCRDVKAAMPDSQNLIYGMDQLRQAYLTLGRREAEAAYVRRWTIIGAAGGFAFDVVTGAILFGYNRKDRRWCAEYDQETYPSTLYNKQRKMMA